MLKSLSALRSQALDRRPTTLPAQKQSFPLDIVENSKVAPARHREPEKALTFMSDLNAQLGLKPEMVEEKNQLMAESSHAFFRATPALFYHDLQSTYRESSQLLPQAAPNVTILGDAHALNAGTFRGPEGKAVWGLNDFDQAETGSPEWDLERLGVSLYVAARSGGQSADDSLDLVKKMGRSYLASLGETGPSFLTDQESSGEIAELIAKAGAKSQKKLLKKWTTEGGEKLLRDDTLVEPEQERGRRVKEALQTTFPHANFLDLASKPHSGGSTRGLERYYALVTTADRDEPWILETKAVLPSPVQIPDGDLSRADGAKVLRLQGEMGGLVDERHRAFQLDQVSFFTREREREKGSLKEKASHLEESAISIGRLLARAHGTSGADLESWVEGQEDLLIQNLADFSRSYARQVESDFRLWKERYAG